MFRKLLCTAAFLMSSSAWAQSSPGNIDIEQHREKSSRSQDRSQLTYPAQRTQEVIQADPTAGRDKPLGPICQACPYGCNDEGFSHWGCRSWQQDGSCCIGPKETTEAPAQ